MPLYEYQCGACGNRFERIQKFSDPPVELCPTCGEVKVEKLLSSPAIMFKGSGFYINNYAKKGAGAPEGAKGDDAPKGSTADTKTSSSDGKTSESKSSRTVRVLPPSRVALRAHPLRPAARRQPPHQKTSDNVVGSPQPITAASRW